jgi:uncharacterized membrane protein
MPSAPEALVHALEHEDALDGPQALIGRMRASVPEPVLEELEGRRLGHALHPLLTDLPIGFWTSAFCIDLVAPRRGATAARRFVALGVVSALPAVATGLADFGHLSPGKRRVAAVHVAANTSATVAYAMSYLARRRGQTFRGVALGMVGAGLASAGGFLGGHLAFGEDSLEDDVQEVAAPPGGNPDQLELLDEIAHEVQNGQPVRGIRV